MKECGMRGKIIAVVGILLLSVLLQMGCVYPGYRGEYPELCSVAWANLVFACGCGRGTEVAYDPVVSVLLEDDFGRVLFRYTEWGREQVDCLCVMQSTDGAVAYYYPEDCYLMLEYDGGRELSEIDTESEDVTALLELNDWGRELDWEKCDRTEIVSKKPTGNLKLKEAKQKAVIREYYEHAGIYVHPKNTFYVDIKEFITADEYGRELYLFQSDLDVYYDKYEISYWYEYLVVFLPDGSYKIETVKRLEDDKNLQPVVKEIKQENGWGTPLS